MQNMLLSFVFIFTGLCVFGAEQDARLTEKKKKHLTTLKQKYLDEKTPEERYRFIGNIIYHAKNREILDSVIASLPLWDIKEAQLRIFHQQFELYELSIPTYTALYQLICKAESAEMVAKIVPEQIPGHLEWVEIRRTITSASIISTHAATSVMPEASEKLAEHSPRTISPGRTTIIINSHMLAEALAEARKNISPRASTPPANLAEATFMISPPKS